MKEYIILLNGGISLIKLILISLILFNQLRGIYRAYMVIRDLKKDKFNIIKLANEEIGRKVLHRHIYKMGVYVVICTVIIFFNKLLIGSSMSGSYIFGTIIWPLLTLSYYWEYVGKHEAPNLTWKTFFKGYLKQFVLELKSDLKYVKHKITHICGITFGFH